MEQFSVMKTMREIQDLKKEQLLLPHIMKQYEMAEEEHPLRMEARRQEIESAKSREARASSQEARAVETHEADLRVKKAALFRQAGLLGVGLNKTEDVPMVVEWAKNTFGDEAGSMVERTFQDATTDEEVARRGDLLGSRLMTISEKLQRNQPVTLENVDPKTGDTYQEIYQFSKDTGNLDLIKRVRKQKAKTRIVRWKDKDGGFHEKAIGMDEKFEYPEGSTPVSETGYVFGRTGYGAGGTTADVKDARNNLTKWAEFGGGVDLGVKPGEVLQMFADKLAETQSVTEAYAETIAYFESKPGGTGELETEDLKLTDKPIEQVKAHYLAIYAQTQSVDALKRQMAIDLQKGILSDKQARQLVAQFKELGKEKTKPVEKEKRPGIIRPPLFMGPTAP